MVPTISVVGRSGAGKTFLLERMIGWLKGRGYCVAAAKHSPFKFDIDVEGKDSWRLFKAGAQSVLLFSPYDLVCFSSPRGDISGAELPRFFPDEFDILFIEGFRMGRLTKIEAHRKQSGDLLCPPEELWAVVSDQNLSLPPGPALFSWDEIPKLCELIERTFLSPSKPSLELYVNDKPILLKPFVQEIILRAVLGMVSSLKDISEIKRIEIRARGIK